MSSVDEEIACAALVLFGGYYLLMKNDKKKKVRKRLSPRIWVREWLEKRQSQGAFANLMQELRTGDDADQREFYRLLKMTPENFDYLLDLVAPLISKQDTTFRRAISPGERLAVTLCFLSTGQSFQSLQYLFRISQPSISKFVPTVLDAIWTVLKDKYMQVRFKFSLTSISID